MQDFLGDPQFYLVGVLWIVYRFAEWKRIALPASGATSAAVFAFAAMVVTKHFGFTVGEQSGIGVLVFIGVRDALAIADSRRGAAKAPIP
jgi:hypothetical protein